MSVAAQVAWNLFDGGSQSAINRVFFLARCIRFERRKGLLNVFVHRGERERIEGPARVVLKDATNGLHLGHRELFGAMGLAAIEDGDGEGCEREGTREDCRDDDLPKASEDHLVTPVAVSVVSAVSAKGCASVAIAPSAIVMVRASPRAFPSK